MFMFLRANFNDENPVTSSRNYHDRTDDDNDYDNDDDKDENNNNKINNNNKNNNPLNVKRPNYLTLFHLLWGEKQSGI